MNEYEKLKIKYEELKVKYANDLKHFLECYPILFPDPPSSGYTIKHGWFDLVDELASKIEKINLSLPEEERAVCRQVKEKFGGLRFYISRYTDQFLSYGNKEIHNLILDAEETSGMVCEDTGEPGICCQSDHRWIRTLCPERAKELGFVELDKNPYDSIRIIMQ